MPAAGVVAPDADVEVDADADVEVEVDADVDAGGGTVMVCVTVTVGVGAGVVGAGVVGAGVVGAGVVGAGVVGDAAAAVTGSQDGLPACAAAGATATPAVALLAEAAETEKMPQEAEASKTPVADKVTTVRRLRVKRI